MFHLPMRGLPAGSTLEAIRAHRALNTGGAFSFPPFRLGCMVFMFANLLQLISRRPRSGDYDLTFVAEVQVATPREPRSRRCERLLATCWVLIGLKSWAVWWLIEVYQVPISPWWIIAPTLGAAGACTGLYLWRR